MKLTAGQETALQSVRDLGRTHPEGGGIGVISGYAGTGKTTLISVLQEEHEDDLLVVTPTGKAAVRVREAAGARAMTIHRWLYAVIEDEKTGEVSWKLRDATAVELPRCGFLVVDEASMMGYEVFRDVYRCCVKLGLNLVLVGDGFQLPPVERELFRQDFSVFSPELPAHFKVQLTEILRQALDSPIIRVSQQIREGRWAEEALGQLPAVHPNDLQDAMVRARETGGATICHRNATRHFLNSQVRTALGLGDGLAAEEPLLVTQNNYGLEIYNGEVVDVDRLHGPINVDPVAVRDRFRGSSCFANFLEVEVRSPVLGPRRVLVTDREVFGTLGDVGPAAVRHAGRWLLETRMLSEPDFAAERESLPQYLHANLGYTLTCHKSQGSEFPEVLVVLEDSIRLGTPDGRRWAYTACTRAKKILSVCWY